MKTWIKRVAVVFVALAGLAAAVVLGFLWTIRIPTIDATPDDAMARFARVLNGDAAQQETALSALAGAIDKNPDHARLHLWFGLANMHKFLETRALPDAIRASRALDRAVELDPEDTSAAGWRAFWRYQAARSRENDLEAPRQALLKAAEADPRFTPFLVAVSLSRLPLDTGFPQNALRDLEKIEDCGDGTSSGCRTSPFFPHGTEGFHATLGDLKLRLGDWDGAQQQYRRALNVKTSSVWPHRSAFEQWVQGAESRMKLLTNENLQDDPPIFFAHGKLACAACHQRSLSSPTE